MFRSREWALLSNSERVHLGLTFEHDGEFWMSFADFSSNFTTLEIVHLGPQMSGIKEQGLAWSCEHMEGSGRRRVSAGGSRNFIGNHT